MKFKFFSPHLHKRTPKETFMEQQFLGLKADMEKNRSFADKIADFLTNYFGTVNFFSINAVFFVIWIVLNRGIVPGIAAFDPFPYSLLTMIVSLEAIFLSIIVMISQNRASSIADLREELALLVNVRAEEEITRVLNLLDEIHNHMGLKPSTDIEFLMMKEKTDIHQMREQLIIELHQNA